jgi:16S rRNA (cytosine967-C5)-methyltransferase
MTPGGRIAAAIEVLGDIEKRHRPVAEALKDWGVSHRFAGSKDRAAIGNIVYDALRWRSSSAWVMETDSPRALVLAALGRHWGLGSDGLSAAFVDSPHAPEPLSGGERALIDMADLAAAPPHVRADVPEWLADRFARTFGDAAWVAEGEALAARPPLDLRVNRLKAEREKVAKALAKFSPAETALAPDGLRIAATAGDGRHPNVQVEPAFQKGLFEIQDEGSQVAAFLANARPGEQIIDLCAGAGGKTLALASAMDNKGQVFATDSDRSRLAPIFDRLKRAATRNVQVRPAGSELVELQGRMDAVLLDVPCTGAGTWRRRPDAKWRLAERALDERIAEQAALLDAAVAYLKPGGRIVYVTCSLLPDENGDQLRGFLSRHEDFALVPPAEVIASSALSDAAKEALAVTVGDEGLLLTPHRTDTDGFFVGVVRKA